MDFHIHNIPSYLGRDILVVTRIWVGNGWINIKPEQQVTTTRRLRSFCVANCLPDKIVKSQGGYYNLTKDGTFVPMEKHLYLITFEEVYKLLNK